MRLCWFVIAVGTLLLPACGSKPGAGSASRTHPVRWSAKALEVSRLSEIEAGLTKPFEDPVPVRRGKETGVVTNCSTCVELLAQGYEPPLDRDLQVLTAMALKCLALQALQAASPSATSYLTQFRFDSGALARLPPALALAVSTGQSKRRQEAGEKQLSWSQFDPAATARAENEDTLRVEGPGWEQRLEVIARGDFDGDGVEDWMVQDEAWMTEGTYRSVRLFLLARTGPGDQLRVIRELAPSRSP